MIIDQDIADMTLHHMGRSRSQPYVVVIGAMDGVSFDDFHTYIARYRWSGLFVEPVAEQFRRLREYYEGLPQGGDMRFENCAIADHDGTIRMLTIDQDAVDGGKVHPCFGGMSAIYPPRNGLAHPDDAAVVEAYGRLIEVPCLTLPSLLARHAVTRVDLLCIDAEGWDYRILRQLDFSTFRPQLIRCEVINLAEDERAAIEQLLDDHRYVIRRSGSNLDAVTAESWSELKAHRRTTRDCVASADDPGRVTLVTGVFDLSAGDADLLLRQAFAVYLEHVIRLLRVPWPMIVFTQPELEPMVRRVREPCETHIVVRPLADFEAFPFLEELRQLDAATGAGASAEPDEPRPRYRLPFLLSRQFLLNDATFLDPFDSPAFLWVDADIAAAIGDPVASFTDACARTLAAILRDDRMLYVCRPLRRQADGSALDTWIEAGADGEPPSRVDASVFGGTALIVNAINGIYYGRSSDSLVPGGANTADELFTIIARTYRHLCTLDLLGEGEALAQMFARWQQVDGDSVNGAAAPRGDGG